MNCPTCGAPDVRIHGDQWECTWCCDFGFLSSDDPGARKTARERQNAWWQNAAATTRNAALTFVEAVTRLLPTYPESKSFAWRVVLCQVSAGLIESGLWNKTWDDEVDDSVIGHIFYPYRSLASDLADFSGISNRRVMERSVRSRKPLFQAEGQLTDKVCGKFWEMMIEQLPPYDKEDPSMQDGHLYMGRAFGGKNRAESAIEDALCSILPLAAFFAGCIGENADTRNNRFLGYFTEHWKRLRGEKVNPMDYADSAVARIVAQFPELKNEYARADLFNMFGEDLLEGIYNTDPQRAIAMWRSLPQKQAPLQDDGLSEDFFCLIDFLWKSEECDEDALTPLLDAVQRDDTLAEMVFHSHYVCTLHLYLIQTAIEQGKAELAEHLYAMLQLNPLPREKWREDPDAFTALMKDLYNTADHVPTYRYCSVQVGNNRPYAYLTAGLPVKRGDHVRVPYGKRNEPKEGVVRSVGDYTRDTAPWPPEKTKRVLGILPKPQESVKKEPATPKPQQVEDETANPKASPVTEEASPTSGADTTPVAETPQETAPPKKRKFVPILVAVVLTLVVVGVLVNSHNRRVAWEQQYQTAAALFAEGNYKKAAELAKSVPTHIAEQPALLTVAKAGVLLNANTEESLRDGLDLLKYARDLGSYSEQGTILQAELTARLQELLYEKAISLLHKEDAYAARDCLRELGDYKDAATILAYTHALADSQSFSVILYRWALESLQAIPADYNGEFAEEIAALRDALPVKIAEQEQVDAERAASLAQQQQQKPKPPQTFNYGGGSTDTGPGSGHGLREDYDDPEDLYEDGDYDDLDEAWDEWEEGW